MSDGARAVKGRGTGENPRNRFERAWFEQCPIEVEWTSRDYVTSRYTVVLKGFLFERTMTMLVTCDVETGETHRIRLDRIGKARCLPKGS